MSVLYIAFKLKDKKTPVLEEEEFGEVNQQEEATGSTHNSVPQANPDSERCATASDVVETNHIDIQLELRDKMKTDNLGVRRLTRLDLACPSAIEGLEDVCDKDITLSESGDVRPVPRVNENHMRL